MKKNPLYHALVTLVPGGMKEIEYVRPVLGKDGQEMAELSLRGGSGTPVILAYSVPRVMRGIARMSGWKWEDARAIGAHFLDTKQGGVYPLDCRTVFLAIKMRVPAYRNQPCWGYVNVAHPLERLEESEAGCALTFPSGHQLSVCWTRRTVFGKWLLAQRIQNRMSLLVPQFSIPSPADEMLLARREWTVSGKGW